jgi:hypothetical protein
MTFPARTGRDIVLMRRRQRFSFLAGENSAPRFGFVTTSLVAQSPASSRLLVSGTIRTWGRHGAPVQERRMLGNHSEAHLRTSSRSTRDCGRFVSKGGGGAHDVLEAEIIREAWELNTSHGSKALAKQ